MPRLSCLTSSGLIRFNFMVIQPGVRLGRYEVRSLLDTGGMGEVYLAFDPGLRRQVAIKLLHGDVPRTRIGSAVSNDNYNLVQPRPLRSALKD